MLFDYQTIGMLAGVALTMALSIITLMHSNIR